MRNIFVDGYNVINSWSVLKQTKNYSFESARQHLIELLTNYAAFNGYKIFIVFDAQLVTGSMEKKEKVSDNVTIVFTKEGETEDAYIEKTVNNIGRKNEVFVVTSDKLEQQLVFQRGAVRMSSLEFCKEVEAINHKIHSKIEINYSDKKHALEDRIDKKILDELEKIRRSE
ncbi:MAG: NYN domain-containing protein [Clostridium sp.]|uniref:NYN domain-containing protein n=1 Tax=Clostridium sp. TaxID=1506 RepID=UPI0025B989AA|nr:NYN domain-containing protein [Clostridium sp.]MCH3965655.1 NYN domain-containing protein [Clostridium sp.]MCI1717031.1 NYN domain-containing protein [Clostridium sp.]MCI1801432.1 NYN domain-containing protein [Clostridium sp.]MCI1815278.1 NYN domain-containing protein [Clostridium sp.]MCI1872181.1 NYN domain-containing protein [Clostridium sp.]